MKKIIKNSALALLILIVSFIISCGRMTKKEYDSIHGRNFTFQKFYYYQKGTNKDNAFKIMKYMPINKVLKILEHKYDILIDNTDFNFFLSANDPSKIKTEGLIFNTEYTWESSNKNPNIIEFELIVKPKDIMSEPVTEFNLIIKVDNKKESTFLGYLFKTKPVLPEIAKRLRYERVNINSDDIYVNIDNNKQVNLASAEVLPVAKIESEKEGAITQEELKQEIKKYIESMPAENRKKFRDDIIKYLYTIIE